MMKAMRQPYSAASAGLRILPTTSAIVVASATPIVTQANTTPQALVAELPVLGCGQRVGVVKSSKVTKQTRAYGDVARREKPWGISIDVCI